MDRVNSTEKEMNQFGVGSSSPFHEPKDSSDEDSKVLGNTSTEVDDGVGVLVDPGNSDNCVGANTHSGGDNEQSLAAIVNTAESSEMTNVNVKESEHVADVICAGTATKCNSGGIGVTCEYSAVNGTHATNGKQMDDGIWGFSKQVSGSADKADVPVIGVGKVDTGSKSTNAGRSTDVNGEIDKHSNTNCIELQNLQNNGNSDLSVVENNTLRDGVSSALKYFANADRSHVVSPNGCHPQSIGSNVASIVDSLDSVGKEQGGLQATADISNPIKKEAINCEDDAASGSKPHSAKISHTGEITNRPGIYNGVDSSGGVANVAAANVVNGIGMGNLNVNAASTNSFHRGNFNRIRSPRCSTASAQTSRTTVASTRRSSMAIETFPHNASFIPNENGFANYYSQSNMNTHFPHVSDQHSDGSGIGIDFGSLSDIMNISMNGEFDEVMNDVQHAISVFNNVVDDIQAVLNCAAGAVTSVENSLQDINMLNSVFAQIVLDTTRHIDVVVGNVENSIPNVAEAVRHVGNVMLNVLMSMFY